MRMPHAVLVAALLLSPHALAQDAAADAEQARRLAEMCANADCQRNLRVTVKNSIGFKLDETFELFPPIVQPFGFMVVAGQTVHVEADIVDGKLANLVAVDTVANPGKTITAKLEQVDGGGMMLTVSNPFREILKFNMGIVPLEQDDLYKTSSCPVIAGGQSMELWPDPLFQVALANGHVLAPSDNMACVD